jgi:hypothetical protein
VLYCTADSARLCVACDKLVRGHLLSVVTSVLYGGGFRAVTGPCRRPWTVSGLRCTRGWACGPRDGAPGAH